MKNVNIEWAGCTFKLCKKAAGRLLDGRTHDEFPESAQT